METKQVAWGWATRPQYVNHLWGKYRLTLERFNDIWADQEGKCAGCAAEFAHPTNKALKTGVRPEVDHDHTTSGDDIRVRGLLCRRCNDFLGKIQDNKSILINLTQYLLRNGEELL